MSVPGRRTLAEDYVCTHDSSGAVASSSSDDVWAPGAAAEAGRRVVLDAIAGASLEELDRIRAALVSAFSQGALGSRRPAMVPLQLPPLMDRAPATGLQVHHNDIPGLMVRVDRRRAQLTAEGATRAPVRTSPTAALDGTAATAEVLSDARVQFLLERVAAESDPSVLHLLSTELVAAQGRATGDEVTIVLYGPSRVPAAALPHLAQITEQRYRQVVERLEVEAAPDPGAAPDVAGAHTSTPAQPEPSHEGATASGSEVQLTGRLPTLRFPEHGTRPVGFLDLSLRLGGNYGISGGVGADTPSTPSGVGARSLPMSSDGVLAPGAGAHHRGSPHPRTAVRGGARTTSVGLQGWLLSALPQVAEHVPSFISADTLEAGVDGRHATGSIGLNLAGFDVTIGDTPIHIAGHPEVALVQREVSRGAAEVHFGTVSFACALSIERVVVDGVEYRVAGTLTIGLFSLDRWLSRQLGRRAAESEGEAEPETGEASEPATEASESVTETASEAAEAGELAEGTESLLATGSESVVAADEAGAALATGTEVAEAATVGATLGPILMAIPAAILVAAIVLDVVRTAAAARDAARREADRERLAALGRRGDAIASTVRGCCLAYQAVMRGQPQPHGAGAAGGARAAQDRIRSLSARFTIEQIHARARELDLYRAAFDAIEPEIVHQIAEEARDIGQGSEARTEEARAIFERRLLAMR